MVSSESADFAAIGLERVHPLLLACYHRSLSGQSIQEINLLDGEPWLPNVRGAQRVEGLPPGEWRQAQRIHQGAMAGLSMSSSSAWAPESRTRHQRHS